MMHSVDDYGDVSVSIFNSPDEDGVSTHQPGSSLPVDSIGGSSQPLWCILLTSVVMFKNSIHQMQKESLLIQYSIKYSITSIQYSIPQMQKESLLIHPAPRFPLTSWETLDERLLSHEISSFILFNIKETSYWTHRNFCSRRHIVRTNYGIKHNTIRTLFLFCFSALFGDHNQLGPIFKCHGLCTLYSVFTQVEMTFRGDEKLVISPGNTLWLLFDIDDHPSGWCRVLWKTSGYFHATFSVGKFLYIFCRNFPRIIVTIPSS